MRRLEPAYRPVHVFSANGVAVGATTGDLIRLAGLGQVWLARLGVTRDNAIALVGGAGSGVEAWELSGGTRRSGVALAVVDDPAAARLHNPTMVAGPAVAVRAALKGGAWDGLRTALVFGPETVRAARVDVRRAWAPPGTRSVWFECVGGSEFGWHTNESADVIDLDDSGEVLWTGLGWAGTVFLRLRTGLIAERVVDEPCPRCGHVGTRVFAAPRKRAPRRTAKP